ncbi:MAG TPA: hypothetical protein VGK48_10790 [Terriglobia bacterium]|jgi:hypothetical protein
MELHRLGVKFFASDPASIHLEDLIPVFHGWIQRQVIPGHVLIDVHDYSHIQNGPGILLVAHEGNFSLDMSDGRPGLFYYRKTPTALPATEHIAAIVKSAVQACALLEKDAKVAIKMDEGLVIANDRLEAPNDEATLAELKPAVAAALQQVFPGAAFNLSRANSDPKERLAITVQRV